MPKASGSTGRHRYAALQWLRAVAAGLVVYAHGLSNWAEKGIGGVSLENYPFQGEFGVKLFFCISGFIIVQSARAIGPGPSGAAEFMRRRLIRIVPLYWLVTAFFLLKFTLSGQTYSASDIIRSFAFIPYLDADGVLRPILGQGWTLDYEMFFYVSFALMMLLPRALQLPGLFALMGGLVLSRALGWLLQGESVVGEAIYLWANEISLYFLSGVGVAVFARWWQERRLPLLSATAGVVLMVGGVLLQGFYLLPRHEGIALELMPLVCVLLTTLSVLTDVRGTSRVGGIGTLAGDASYSTYLTHGLFTGALVRGAAKLALPFGHHGFAILSLLVCTALGVLVYQWIETPLLRRLR